MSNNTKTRILTILGAFLLLALVLGVACGSSSDSAEDTPQSTEVGDGTELPDSTSEPDETAEASATPPANENGPVDDATPDEDPVADETRRTIRSIEVSVLKLSSLSRSLVRSVGLGGNFTFGTPAESAVDWFDDCCDDSVDDFDEELRDITRSLPELVEIYEEASDQESLGLVERIGTEAANISASLAVLASQASRDTASSVLEEISSEITAMADAVANLR